MTNEDAGAWVTAHLERCRPYLERAIARSEGSFDWEHVKGEIENGNAQIWPGTQTAVVTKIETHPSGVKSCLLWLAGGDDLDELRRMEPQIAAWAKDAMGCDRMELIGRRGWLRSLDDYREASTLMVRDL